MSFFFFNDTATTEIYTLSLHDALPISDRGSTIEPCQTRSLLRSIRPPPSGFGACCRRRRGSVWSAFPTPGGRPASSVPRSEEHTSELQSQSNLVCRLLLENKN